MTAKVIVVTGISGSGSKEFCQKYGQRGGVKVYNTGAMITSFAEEALERRIPGVNFLNRPQDELTILGYGVSRKIANDLESGGRDRYNRIVIDAHCKFFWNNQYKTSLRKHMLEGINPDMFVTIIDKPSAVRDRQLQTEQGRIQNHNLKDMLLWMQDEVIATEALASVYKAPHYIFSSKQSTDSVESLLQNEFLIYSSFPMTDASPETTAKINEFKVNLRGLTRKHLGLDLETPVIDPADIDIETGEGLSDEERDAIARHTIFRDLEWDVGKASHVIAYYPNAETDLSAGVMHECIRGMETSKHVYLITPRVRKSPFLEKNATKVFPTRAEFLEFFDKKFKEDWANLARK